MRLNSTLHNYTFLFFCGVLFTAIFGVSYSLIDHDLFEYRDDGVITMSVGRNIVDYGFVGVSPSGPIVEASSSPLQTLLYAIVYYLTKMDYATYSWMQTYVSTAMIGLIVGKFFSAEPKLGMALSLGCALILSLFYSFFLWHASGMENALAHLLYLLTLYLLYEQVKTSHIQFLYALPVFLTATVRIEAILHVSILLCFFSAYWWLTYKNFRAVVFTTVVVTFWCFFQLTRYIYFGDLLPNTAYAQNISIEAQLTKLLQLDFVHIYETARTIVVVFLKQGWWIALVFMPLYFEVKSNESNKFLLLSVLALGASILLSPVLFGSARIDPTRTTTQLTLLIVFSIFFALFHAKDIKKSGAIFAKLIPVFVLAYFVTYGLPQYLGKSQGIGPYYLGWSTKGFNSVRERFTEIASDHQIARPTVANPDLGVMTWYKQFNVVDLGMLGTPEMAKLQNSPLLSHYFLNVALPDIIESHGYWTRKYCDSLFLTESFQQKYEMLHEKNDIKDICQSAIPPMRFWIRKDIKISAETTERKFLNDLQNNLSVLRIKEEIARCTQLGSDCSYIARNVYRFIPELRAARIYTETASLFSNPVDLPFINGWENAKSHRYLVQSINP